MKSNLLKRSLALLLAVFMILTVSSAVFAVSEDEGEIVAEATYYCYVKSPGHCWIYVENLTDETFTVGIYELEPYGGVSVGTFGHTRYDGWGIYYNIEAYVQETHGIGKCTTFSEQLTREKLEKLSNTIYSYKNSWNYFRNCTSFAAKAWNSISSKKVSALLFPTFVRFMMNLRNPEKKVPDMKSVPRDRVYRQIGNGSDAYLKTVKDRSLRSLA